MLNCQVAPTYGFDCKFMLNQQVAKQLASTSLPDFGMRASVKFQNLPILGKVSVFSPSRGWVDADHGYQEPPQHNKARCEVAGGVVLAPMALPRWKQLVHHTRPALSAQAKRRDRKAVVGYSEGLRLCESDPGHRVNEGTHSSPRSGGLWVPLWDPGCAPPPLWASVFFSVCENDNVLLEISFFEDEIKY